MPRRSPPPFNDSAERGAERPLRPVVSTGPMCATRRAISAAVVAPDRTDRARPSGPASAPRAGCRGACAIAGGAPSETAAASSRPAPGGSASRSSRGRRVRPACPRCVQRAVPRRRAPPGPATDRLGSRVSSRSAARDALDHLVAKPSLPYLRGPRGLVVAEREALAERPDGGERDAAHAAARGLNRRARARVHRSRRGWMRRANVAPPISTQTSRSGRPSVYEAITPSTRPIGSPSAPIRGMSSRSRRMSISRPQWPAGWIRPPARARPRR